MVSKEQVEEINNKTSIVDLVGEYVSLTKKGANQVGLCPFHNDSSPSFFVSPEKNICKCMSCNEGGRPITFLMKIKNIPFLEAVSILASKLNIDVNDSQVSNQSNQVDENKLKQYKALEDASIFYTKNLDNTQDGLDAKKYLIDRGINEENIKTFKIGLSPIQNNSLYKLFKHPDYNYDDSIIEELGLVRYSNINKEFHDSFTRRIIFPISDENSKIVGFSGRSYLKKDLDNKDTPKYFNSIDSNIFKKSNVLYNLNIAIPYIRKMKRIILVEGFMDVIALSICGFHESVCSMGTALTKNQVSLIKKYTNDVIVCYDGDNAGIKATTNAIDMLSSAGIDVKIIYFKDNMDPDEYISKLGKEQFIDFFNNNQLDAIQFKYEVITNSVDLSNVADIERAKNRLISILLFNVSNLLIDSYLKKFASFVNISFDTIKQDFDRTRDKTFKPNNKTSNDHEPNFYGNDYYDNYYQTVDVENNFDTQKEVSEKQQTNTMNKFEESQKRLIIYSIKNKRYAYTIDEKINFNNFSENNAKIFEQLIDVYYNKYDEFDLNIFSSMNETSKKALELFSLNENSSDVPFTEIKFNDIDFNLCLATVNLAELIDYKKDVEKEIKLFNPSNLDQDDKKINLTIKNFSLLQKCIEVQRQIKDIIKQSKNNNDK
ncbi:MAG: DNA primase [Anaeroplasmataceae bacterium]